MKRNATARLVFEFSEIERAGDFYYSFDRSGMAHSLTYRCPCGCEAIGTLPIARVKLPHGWKWDGNIQRPTLTPSIHHIGHWHGYLTDGEFKE